MAKPKTLPYDADLVPAPFSVTLHNTSGGSDKIYKLSVEPEGDGWMVRFANGRRGGTLATGTKTKAPVGYDEARKVCNAQLYDKVGGGYVPVGGSRFGDGMTAEAIATVARESSGHVPQLLAPMDEDELETYVCDDRYVAEPKHDGERRVLVVRDGVASGGNRKGQTVTLTAAMAASAVASGRDYVLDGEQVGDTFHFWDVLSFDGRDVRSLPLRERLALLEEGRYGVGNVIVPVETCRGTDAKRRLLERVRAAGGEGVVFKRLDSSYEPGRPGVAPSWRKFKLWNSLSAVVTRVNEKRSVALGLRNGHATLAVGNVTVPANHAVPSEGDVVEVGYLYAFDGGSLFQPTYKGPRVDISPEECRADQRVFKPEVEPAEEDTPGLRM